MIKLKITAVIMLTLFFAGCFATPQQGAIGGGLAGAAGGAALGALIGAAAGSPEAGALIGGAIGGVVGSAIGASAGAENQQRLCQTHQYKLMLIPHTWRGSGGEFTGELQEEGNRLTYWVNGDHLLWNPATQTWETED